MFLTKGHDCSAEPTLEQRLAELIEVQRAMTIAIGQLASAIASPDDEEQPGQYGSLDD